jgi:tRNA A-37 threonylcarbamoyl transferase component Bud32
MSQQLEEILKAIPKFQDADFEKIYNGTFNEVCQVRNKNINYIAKMALKDLKSDRFQGIQIDPFARIDIEFRVARLYADILGGHHIPKIRYYYPDKCIIIMDAIDGILWRKQLIEGNFDPSVLIRLGSVIGRLHAGTYGKYSEDDKFVNRDAWEAELKYHFYDLLPKVDDKTAKIIEQRAINHRKDRSVLLHGDLVTRNIIIGDRGEFFLIDFELSRLGNPSYDLGHLFGDFFLFIGYCPKYKYEVLSLFSTPMKILFEFNVFQIDPRVREIQCLNKSALKHC